MFGWPRLKVSLRRDRPPARRTPLLRIQNTDDNEMVRRRAIDLLATVQATPEGMSAKFGRFFYWVLGILVAAGALSFAFTTLRRQARVVRSKSLTATCAPRYIEIWGSREILGLGIPAVLPARRAVQTVGTRVYCRNRLLSTTPVNCVVEIVTLRNNDRAMLAKRIIPCLDVHAGRVVKGINFLNLRDAGDPVEVASRYESEGADELVFLDITASHEERAIMLDVVRRTSEVIFMPLTVGGGIRTLDDIRILLKAGCDKVSINSAAVKNPHFVRRPRCVSAASASSSTSIPSGS